jgi:uncharacterized protein
VDIAARVRPAARWTAAVPVVAALAVAAAALRVLGAAGIPGLQNFFLVFGSLLIEAIPFIMLGATVAAAIEVFVPPTWFERLSRLPRPLQLPAAALGGLAFPVCECGSVPVARRLVSKGMSPAAAITFMLAAPILNPVVIASTFVAYRGRDTLWTMVLGRAGLGLIAAVTVGWIIGSRTRGDVLRDLPASADPAHEPARLRAFFGHLSSDFVFMGRYLVIGAAVAAGLQTFVPQSIVGSVAGTPVVDILAMMGLAFLLSLCSESDAFVAASFVQFGPSAQLAFLTFGPMLDTKLAFLYSGTFRGGFVRMVALGVGAVTLAGTLWIGVIAG